MDMHLPHRGQNDTFRFLLLALPALTLVGHFVLPGWTSAGLVLLDLTGLCALLRPSLRAQYASLLRLPQVRWMLLALAAPLLAVAFGSIAHGELVPRRFEGPMRLFLAGTVLLAFAAHRIDFSRAISWAAPLATAICAAWVLDPDATIFYWGEAFERAATIFMDPITLSYQMVLFGFMIAFLLPGASSWPKRLAMGVGAVLALVVSLETGSRTGWALVPLFAALLAWRYARGHKARLAGMLALVAALLGAAYFFLPGVQERLTLLLQEVQDYLNGGARDTSVGVRLALFRTNLILIAERPWLGWGYTVTPDILSIPAIRELATPRFMDYWTTSGGHNEYLQSTMRMGVVGLLSRVLVILLPLAVFVGAARSGDPVRSRNGFLGLFVVVAYMSTGLTQEVFNLSYSVSLYALLVSTLAAGALPQPVAAAQATRPARQGRGSRACLT